MTLRAPPELIANTNPATGENPLWPVTSTSPWTMTRTSVESGSCWACGRQFSLRHQVVHLRCVGFFVVDHPECIDVLNRTRIVKDGVEYPCPVSETLPCWRCGKKKSCECPKGENKERNIEEGGTKK